MDDEKTITITETAYERLKARKRKGEGFSDVVERLTGGRSLLEITGTGDPDDGYAERVTAAGASLDRSVEEVGEELRDR